MKQKVKMVQVIEPDGRLRYDQRLDRPVGFRRPQSEDLVKDCSESGDIDLWIKLLSFAFFFGAPALCKAIATLCAWLLPPPPFRS